MVGILAIVAAGSLAAGPSPQFEWTVTSWNGTATLTQVAQPEGCSLSCSVKGQQAWTQRLCLGRKTDFVFAADDCSGALMLEEYPLAASPSGATGVAQSLSAKGSPATLTSRLFRLQELLDPSALRGEGRRVRWLAGVVGEPGVKPHYNSAGTGIEFTTGDGVTRAVRFANPEDFLYRAPAAVQPRAQASGAGLYQYVGADGSTQFVMGLDQVPRKYRKSARPVESDIGTVEATKMPTRRAAPREESQAAVPPIGKPAERTTPSPPPASAPACGIYGLSGAACQAVQLGSGMVLQPTSSPARPEMPTAPPSPYK